MIDFSKWHSLKYQEKLLGRLWVNQEAKNDQELQAIIKALCKQDYILAIELFFFTRDPKKKPANLPFILYPFQKDLIKWYHERMLASENGLVEKSRQVGITWVTMAFILCHWLFNHDTSIIVGSRKEELVDRGSSKTGGKEDTLFYKLDYNIQRLPYWILPYQFNFNRDRRHLLLVNKNASNVIWGESSNPNFGRGSSTTLAYLDEFSSWEDAASSWTSISEAAKTSFIISTPASHTYFKTLRFSGQIPVKTIHWRQHPEKTQKWYEKQKTKFSIETISQELDLAYDVTGRGKVYEEAELVEIGNFPYNPKLSLYTATDYGLSDNTAIIWAQHDPKTSRVYIIDSYQNSQKTIEFYIPFYKGVIEKDNPYRYEYTKEEKLKIAEHKKWKSARHFGDPAGKQRTLADNVSVIAKLGKAGIHVFTRSGAQVFPIRREATKILLRNLCVDKKTSMEFIQAIKDSRYPKRRESSSATSPANVRPVHDSSADYRASLEYLAVNLRIKKGQLKRINYLKNDSKLDEEGNLSPEQIFKEKKAKVLRWSFRSY